ncbi:D-alanyl-D-alanine carboxypeptidase [Streptomyces sp. NPDC085946]|uniref:D-alanyl-D-alanine carboxypeptidase n=1 Tax=Streptomyces sp. NPDC085946 TaxID=3365744 RepID=UPI0037D676B2
MAGESPDRSKQRESSAEPTSGSAGPVPGARDEADAPRDPRLAVAREAAASSGARGTVETATRVRESEEAERKASDSGSDSDSDSGSGSGSEVTDDPGVSGASRSPRSSDSSGGGKGEGVAEARDGRLRDAVAAWVRSADDAEESAAEGREDGAQGPAGAGRDGDAEGGTTGDAAEQDTADAEEADRSRDTGATAKSGNAPAKAATGTEPATPDAGTTKPLPTVTPDTDTDADGDSRDTGATAKSGNTPAKAATGTEPATPDAGTTKPLPTVTPDTDTDTDADSDSPGVAPAGERAVTDAQDGADGADGAGKPARDRSAEDGGDKAGGDETGGGERVVDQPTAVFKTVRPSAPAVDQPTTMLKLGGAAKADGTAGDEPGAGSDGTADPKTGAEANGETNARADGKADAKAGAGAGAEPGAKTDAKADAKADAEPGAKTDAEPDAEPGSPAVGKDAPAGKGAARTPEADAERTSKFVALKDPDDPATRRPKAAGATTVLPRVPAPGGTGGTGEPPRVSPAEATAAVPQVGPERTTQQPLPPKPPLDLLAELTNTPPPPETPLRTAVRRVKIWTPLVLLLVVVFAVVQSVRPLPAPTLDLTAKDSYTFEGGKVDIPWPSAGQAALDVQGIGTFGSSGEQKPVPIASVAKVMTAYLILREHPLKSGAEGPEIEIDQAAEDQSDAGQESTVNVEKGDKISQREALEGILIASANNVARLLARWDAGSEKAFVAKMNDAAKDLGMTNTTYTDPSGLNNTTVSTAVDQVKLAKAAMKQPAFREVAAMMSYDDYKDVNHPNWNQLVGSNGVVGIKTGTTTSALGNLVFAAKKEIGGETRTIVGAVVRQPAGGPDNTILSAALYEGDRLIRAAQGALESATILKKGDVVGYADDGLGGRTPVVATEDVKAVGWAGLTVKLTFAADDLPHTAKAGTEVGTLTVGDGSSSAVTVPVALQKDLAEPGFADRLTRIG